MPAPSSESRRVGSTSERNPTSPRQPWSKLSPPSTAAAAGADTVLIPGHPLAQAEHAALGNELLCQDSSRDRLGLLCAAAVCVRSSTGTARSRRSAWRYIHGERQIARQRAADAFTLQRAASAFSWQRSTARGRHRQMKLRAVKTVSVPASRARAGSHGSRPPPAAHDVVVRSAGRAASRSPGRTQHNAHAPGLCDEKGTPPVC